MIMHIRAIYCFFSIFMSFFILQLVFFFFFFFQAEDGIRDSSVTGVQTCALPISLGLTIAILLSEGEIRYIVLLLLTILGLVCLSPKRGIFIVLAFLPFMYFLRRQV